MLLQLHIAFVCPVFPSVKNYFCFVVESSDIRGICSEHSRVAKWNSYIKACINVSSFLLQAIGLKFYLPEEYFLVWRNGVGRLSVHDPCIESDITSGIRSKRSLVLTVLVCFLGRGFWSLSWSLAFLLFMVKLEHLGVTSLLCSFASWICLHLVYGSQNLQFSQLPLFLTKIHWDECLLNSLIHPERGKKKLTYFPRTSKLLLFLNKERTCLHVLAEFVGTVISHEVYLESMNMWVLVAILSTGGGASFMVMVSVAKEVWRRSQRRGASDDRSFSIMSSRFWWVEPEETRRIIEAFGEKNDNF